MNKKSKLLAAAIAGIVGATFAASPLLAKGRTKDSSGADKKMEKNACKGHSGCNGGNGCKGSGSCKGTNECKGKGGCKTDKHACKGQNDCKGQGGCGM
jgi:hypothetical protein